MPTNRKLDHRPDCPGPSTFYETRSGYSWTACRNCTATAVRNPRKKS